jgi:hypothetical protein
MANMRLENPAGNVNPVGGFGGNSGTYIVQRKYSGTL